MAAALALVACSDHSPVAPIAGPDGASMARVSAAPGSYVISFLKETSTGLAPAADAEPVGTYLVLKSEVRDAAGNLAQSGSVKYEVCVSRGNYAPSAVCNGGSGSWRRWLSVDVDPIGSLVGFGACTTPQAIGFRFTFSGRQSGIAGGSSQSRDFTWTPA